jgi:N-carbamoyl-L-amino-acid hydrolase
MSLDEKHPKPDFERLNRNLEALAQFGALPTGGVDRQTYSRPYREMINWLRVEMEGAGLKVFEDPAGSLIGRVGPDGPALLCCSHVDSVPRGGRFDGTLGVLAGIECARCFKAQEHMMKCGFEVVAFADEEGCFVSLLGSRAMTGVLLQEEIDCARSRGGLRLTQALKDYGLDPAAVLGARRKPEELVGCIELHIEQGPVLEAEGIAIGLVDTIVGIATGQHELLGQANHSGTTPLDLRHDALRVAALAITRCFAALTAGSFPSTVVNFGRLAIEPGATNVVPSRVVLTQEIRSTTSDHIRRFQELCAAQFSESAATFGVKHRWEPGDFDPPAMMAEEVQARIRNACSSLGFSVKTMPSGAGHDSQLFAERCPTGMIFVPSQGGISHNPEEFSTPGQLAQGLQVLYTTCRSWVMRDP